MTYELQIDNGIGGEFISLIGGGDEPNLETTYTFQNNVSSGSIFRFRYRVKNVNGWSEFSPISHIKAATLPERPPAPRFKSATSTTVSLDLLESTKDGGQIITAYQLFINEGGSSEIYKVVSTYDGMSRAHTLT